MMQFFKTEYFVYLWVLPLLAGLMLYSRRLWESRLRRFADPVTARAKLIPQHRPAHWRLRTLLLLLVFALSILALARPQWGEEKRRVQRKGVDIIFLLDTSLSMLAEDIKPNRLEKSKMEIKSFVRRLKGDRVGMVAFAGSSFLQAPLTLDYAAFFLFLDAINTGYIPDPGTSLDQALRRTVRSFPEDQLKHRAVILFSDGEDHEGGLEETLTEVKEAGVRVYTIGVGTAEGEPIPLKDEQGRRSGYKKDRSGQVVITRLNQPVLEKIASETGGIYLPATPGEQEIELVLRHLETLGQRTLKEQLVTEREDHFQLFLFFAFLFLMMEMFVRKINARQAGQLLGALALFILTSGFLENTASLNKEGNANFEEKKYQTALENYREAQVRSPDDPAVLYNLATALYKLEEYQEARKHLETALKNSEVSEGLKAQALYNYGNTLYRLGDFEKAIEAYQQALEINPDDEDSKYNLEFLQKSKNSFEKQDQDRQKQSQQQEQQQQQQQQQDQQQKQQQQPKQKKDPQEQQQQQPQDQEQKGQDQSQDRKEGEEDNQDQKPADQPQEPKEGQGGQEEQEKDRQEEPQEQSEGQQPKEPQDKPGEQEQPARPEPEPGDQPQDQPQEEQRPEPGQGEMEPQPAGQGGRQPLQGQMTKENALRILDALRESEKDLQDLRRPPQQRSNATVLKDW